MNFKDFKKDVESAFNAMIADNLFVDYVDCGTDVDKFINICLQFK